MALKNEEERQQEVDELLGGLNKTGDTEADTNLSKYVCSIVNKYRNIDFDDKRYNCLMELGGKNKQKFMPKVLVKGYVLPEYASNAEQFAYLLSLEEHTDETLKGVSDIVLYLYAMVYPLKIVRWTDTTRVNKAIRKLCAFVNSSLWSELSDDNDCASLLYENIYPKYAVKNSSVARFKLIKDDTDKVHVALRSSEVGFVDKSTEPLDAGIIEWEKTHSDNSIEVDPDVWNKYAYKLVDKPNEQHLLMVQDRKYNLVYRFSLEKQSEFVEIWQAGIPCWRRLGDNLIEIDGERRSSVGTCVCTKCLSKQKDKYWTEEITSKQQCKMEPYQKYIMYKYIPEVIGKHCDEVDALFGKWFKYSDEFEWKFLDVVKDDKKPRNETEWAIFILMDKGKNSVCGYMQYAYRISIGKGIGEKDRMIGLVYNPDNYKWNNLKTDRERLLWLKYTKDSLGFEIDENNVKPEVYKVYKDVQHRKRKEFINSRDCLEIARELIELPSTSESYKQKEKRVIKVLEEVPSVFEGIHQLGVRNINIGKSILRQLDIYLFEGYSNEVQDYLMQVCKFSSREEYCSYTSFAQRLYNPTTKETYYFSG